MNISQMIFQSMDFDTESGKRVEKFNLECVDFIHTKPIQITLIKNGPKNRTEIKNKFKDYDSYILFSEKFNTVFLKYYKKTHTITINNKITCEHVIAILSSEITSKEPVLLSNGIKNVINKLQNSNIYFDNRGLFASNYLETRLLNEKKEQIAKLFDTIKSNLNNNTKAILKELGWKLNNTEISRYDNVSVVITDKDNFSIREKGQNVVPSYIAISELSNSAWVILTNGKRWRLYTNRVSSSTTNYFEIILDNNEQKIKYLIALFGFDSYIDKTGRTDIDYFFDEGKNYAKKIEDDIADKIMKHDGLFVDIIKGIIDFDNNVQYTKQDLEAAKQDALKILYRLWFLAYAEATNLLPVKNSKYAEISLQNIRTKLDSYNDEDYDCWENVLKIFNGVRNGSPEHNLPQYNGHLFAIKPSIDNSQIKNKFFVHALNELLKQDDEIIDYGNFSVRHLGHIFENLMEYSPLQSTHNLLLRINSKGVQEVKTEKESTHSIKKGDIYLVSKKGIVDRKTTASYYTPEEIVTFLVEKGLEPIFTERKKHIKNDIKRYNKNKNKENTKACIDRLLDIQVLDPAMGSGHFLVETLNRITTWVTNILRKYPNHPLNQDIEKERNTVIKEQNSKGITIDENLLTNDVLLKRKIMKRCIFGVDINPMAVDLTKLSLWLDSFAIGVPLTYMDHHIKVGDSTMGMFWGDLKDKKNTSLDEYDVDISDRLIHDVAMSSDMTINQVHKSEENHQEYQKLIEPKKISLDALTVSKINSDFLPKKTNLLDMIHRFGRYSKDDPVELTKARKIVNELSEKHKFFHWDLEMNVAFKNARWGFDCIVGNPPWEQMRPDMIEFFAPIDPTFKDLTPTAKKNERKEKLLKNKKIKKEWNEYEKHVKEKISFYTTFKLQGIGHKDLSNLIFERILKLIAKNGVISILMPSQLLTIPGSTKLRKEILEKNIHSMYVFDNKNKIFKIHSSYRLLLLTMQNNLGPDKFPVGFYLYDLNSLYNKTKEPEKFDSMSKKYVINSSKDCVMPEIIGQESKILKKLLQNKITFADFEHNWKIDFANRFRESNDSDLFLTNDSGWPVFQGESMHQYTQKWDKPKFTVVEKDGLIRLERTRAFLGKCKEIHDAYRLIFRNITGPGNVRTCISTIIPPHTFHNNSLRTVVLTKNGKIILDLEYDKKIAYLCGILNSMTFDFMLHSKSQTNISGIIKITNFPKPLHEKQISELVAKLLVGTPEFAGFADSFHIPNKKLTLAERIETTAEIDALVADSYDLTVSEYETIIGTFNLFERNPDLHEMDIEINEANSRPYIYQFYGEMAYTALKLYKEMRQ